MNERSTLMSKIARVVFLTFFCASSLLFSPAPSAVCAAEEGVLWSATGKGRIKMDDAQGVMLARRAALTDARRNLLLKQGYEVGRVGPHQIASEWREGNIYYVEVVAREND